MTQHKMPGESRPPPRLTSLDALHTYDDDSGSSQTQTPPPPVTHKRFYKAKWTQILFGTQRALPIGTRTHETGEKDETPDDNVTFNWDSINIAVEFPLSNYATQKPTAGCLLKLRMKQMKTIRYCFNKTFASVAILMNDIGKEGDVMTTSEKVREVINKNSIDRADLANSSRDVFYYDLISDEERHRCVYQLNNQLNHIRWIHIRLDLCSVAAAGHALLQRQLIGNCVRLGVQCEKTTEPMLRQQLADATIDEPESSPPTPIEGHNIHVNPRHPNTMAMLKNVTLQDEKPPKLLSVETLDQMNGRRPTRTSTPHPSRPSAANGVRSVTPHPTSAKSSFGQPIRTKTVTSPPVAIGVAVRRDFVGDRRIVHAPSTSKPICVVDVAGEDEKPNVDAIDEKKPMAIYRGTGVDYTKVWNEEPYMGDRDAIAGYYVTYEGEEGAGHSDDAPADESMSVVARLAPNTVLFKDDWRTDVHIRDLAKLEEEQLLNDTMIEFHLNLIASTSSTVPRDNLHIFNTFFYSKFDDPPREGDLAKAAKTPPSAEARAAMAKLGVKGEQDVINTYARYLRVKNWTRRVDIFDKDMLIIPIHDDVEQHWSVAIVVHPCLTMRESNPAGAHSCIIVLDSLGSEAKRHNAIAANIRRYLALSFAYRGEGGGRPLMEITLRNMPIILPQMIAQTNDFDCGVLVLINVQKLLERPLLRVYDKLSVQHMLQIDDKSCVAKKRFEMIKRIIRLSVERGGPRLLRLKQPPRHVHQQQGAPVGSEITYIEVNHGEEEGINADHEGEEKGVDDDHEGEEGGLHVDHEGEEEDDVDVVDSSFGEESGQPTETQLANGDVAMEEEGGNDFHDYVLTEEPLAEGDDEVPMEVTAATPGKRLKLALRLAQN